MNYYETFMNLQITIYLDKEINICLYR